MTGEAVAVVAAPPLLAVSIIFRFFGERFVSFLAAVVAVAVAVADFFSGEDEEDVSTLVGTGGLTFVVNPDGGACCCCCCIMIMFI